MRLALYRLFIDIEYLILLMAAAYLPLAMLTIARFKRAAFSTYTFRRLFTRLAYFQMPLSARKQCKFHFSATAIHIYILYGYLLDYFGLLI